MKTNTSGKFTSDGTPKRTLTIRNLNTDEVAETLNVTGRSDRAIEQTIRGMLINMDTDNWYVADSADSPDETGRA